MMTPDSFNSWQLWAVLSAVFAALTAMLVALFGVTFLGERPSWNGWLGIALIATGAIFIAIRI